MILMDFHNNPGSFSSLIASSFRMLWPIYLLNIESS